MDSNNDRISRSKMYRMALMFLFCNILTVIAITIASKISGDETNPSSVFGMFGMLFFFVAGTKLWITIPLYLAYFLLIHYTNNYIKSIYFVIPVMILYGLAWFFILLIVSEKLVYIGGHYVYIRTIKSIDVFNLFFSLFTFLQINFVALLEKKSKRI